MKNELQSKDNFLEDYYDKINELILKAKQNVKRNINYEMVELYYQIGKVINELIEKYHLEASQNEIIKSYSLRLTKKFGQGYSVPSLKKMKKFYLTYRGGSTLWNQLSWSHNRLIMNMENETKRNFYLEKSIKANWSVRQLERQINSFYYERLISTNIEKKEKKDTIVKYSVLNDNKNLFASKYQLYLPTEEEFVSEIEKQKSSLKDKYQ